MPEQSLPQPIVMPCKGGQRLTYTGGCSRGILLQLQLYCHAGDPGIWHISASC